MVEEEATAIGIGAPDGTFDAPLCDDWRILDSDMAARMYRNDMQLFFNFGAGSAVRGIKGTMMRFQQRSTSPKKERRVNAGAAHLILQPIEQEIYNLMTLAVQGHFEKGFRRWLRNSLQSVETSEVTDDDIIKAQWSNPSAPRRDLGAIMANLRGVHLSDVVEGPLLLELALVANVVRHGDGPSARQAFERYPDLFDEAPGSEEDGLGNGDSELPERLRVTEERLALYAQAGFQFWHRVQFAYTGEH